MPLPLLFGPREAAQSYPDNSQDDGPVSIDNAKQSGATALADLWNRAENLRLWSSGGNPSVDTSKVSPSGADTSPTDVGTQQGEKSSLPLIILDAAASVGARVPNAYAKAGALAAAAIAQYIASRRNGGSTPGGITTSNDPKTKVDPVQSSAGSSEAGNDNSDAAISLAGQTATPSQITTPSGNKFYFPDPNDIPLFEYSADPGQVTDDNVMDRRTAEQERLWPGDYSNGRHKALMNAEIAALKEIGCKVEPEVLFGADGVPGLARADAVYNCLNVGSPNVLEGKTGLFGRFTFNQAAIYPRIAAGGAFSPDRKIMTFGLPMNAPLPPMNVIKLWARTPDEPPSREIAFPRFDAGSP